MRRTWMDICACITTGIFYFACLILGYEVLAWLLRTVAPWEVHFTSSAFLDAIVNGAVGLTALYIFGNLARRTSRGTEWRAARTKTEIGIWGKKSRRFILVNPTKKTEKGVVWHQANYHTLLSPVPFDIQEDAFEWIDAAAAWVVIYNSTGGLIGREHLERGLGK